MTVVCLHKSLFINYSTEHLKTVNNSYKGPDGSAFHLSVTVMSQKRKNNKNIKLFQLLARSDNFQQQTINIVVHK